mmetsp:Transcript_48630/g.130160  ORF Transcript_48630/g.130160 Transcript_48630/m.130160 type:complete len:259 (-) Transcript_48630:405-1181(-)
MHGDGEHRLGGDGELQLVDDHLQACPGNPCKGEGSLRDGAAARDDVPGADAVGRAQELGRCPVELVQHAGVPHDSHCVGDLDRLRCSGFVRAAGARPVEVPGAGLGARNGLEARHPDGHDVAAGVVLPQGDEDLLGGRYPARGPLEGRQEPVVVVPRAQHEAELHERLRIRAACVGQEPQVPVYRRRVHEPQATEVRLEVFGLRLHREHLPRVARHGQQGAHERRPRSDQLLRHLRGRDELGDVQRVVAPHGEGLSVG